MNVVASTSPIIVAGLMLTFCSLAFALVPVRSTFIADSFAVVVASLALAILALSHSRRHLNRSAA
ncbi:MAG: hypothetical protein ABJB01_05070 [Rudaea sp.]